MADSFIMYQIVAATFIMLVDILLLFRYKYRIPRPSKVFLAVKSNINWMTIKVKAK